MTTERSPSERISWAWVTEDTKLTSGPCDLLYAYLVASGTTTDSYLYDGENASGKRIVDLVAAEANPRHFAPPEPIYCRGGLYVDVGTSVTGIFVMWKDL